MFKDTQVTRLDGWGVTEASDVLPAVGYPFFVGTGKIGIGLDAAGLQALSDRQGAHYQCHAKGFHICQTDLYVLRAGMSSSHLWLDEIEYCGDIQKSQFTDHPMRNLMPLGWLDYRLSFNGNTYEGDELRRAARRWRREWSLREGTVRNRFGISYRVEPESHVEMTSFAPLDGETYYLHVKRTACAGKEDRIGLVIRLNLSTRHGLKLYDQAGAVKVNNGVIRAHIDEQSKYAPAEPYTVLYGAAVDGGKVRCSERGWEVVLDGPANETAEAWIRCDFERLAGDELADTDAREQALLAQVERFDRVQYAAAQQENRERLDAFWGETADIEVVPEDEYARLRRYELHLSEYFLRVGDDHRLGGTATFLLIHQNGWKACNFHDNHWLTDALLRMNQADQALGNLQWMRRVMRTEGRPFPWMLTYDGLAPVPPEQDRAPISDATRAILAIRIYEWAGKRDKTLLRETVYPIVRTVAEHGVVKWFYEREDGSLHFRGVENDVMGHETFEDERGTVTTYLAVMTKAIAYAEQLGLDADRRAAWQEILARYVLPQDDDGYTPWTGPDTTLFWFQCAPYVAEWSDRLNAQWFQELADHETGRSWEINLAWQCFGQAMAEIRFDRPDRAEQLISHAVEESLYGPGYFEECNPLGRAGLAPFSTAHGAYVTATCEQVVRPDLWQPRIFIGMGLPRRWGGSTVTFTNLRTTGGVLVSGTLAQESVYLTLAVDKPAWSGTLVVRLPPAMGRAREVLVDHQSQEHRFHGEFIEVDIVCRIGHSTHVLIAKGVPDDAP